MGCGTTPRVVTQRGLRSGDASIASCDTQPSMRPPQDHAPPTEHVKQALCARQCARRAQQCYDLRLGRRHALRPTTLRNGHPPTWFGVLVPAVRVRPSTAKPTIAAQDQSQHARCEPVAAGRDEASAMPEAEGRCKRKCERDGHDLDPLFDSRLRPTQCGRWQPDPRGREAPQRKSNPPPSWQRMSS